MLHLGEPAVKLPAFPLRAGYIQALLYSYVAGPETGQGIFTARHLQCLAYGRGLQVSSQSHFQCSSKILIATHIQAPAASILCQVTSAAGKTCLVQAACMQQAVVRWASMRPPGCRKMRYSPLRARFLDAARHNPCPDHPCNGILPVLLLHCAVNA